MCRYNKARTFILLLKAMQIQIGKMTDGAIAEDTRIKWDKVFNNGPNKICGRQPLKSLN